MFDTPVRFKRAPESDEEVVERIRRGVAAHDRSRRWLRLFAIAMLLCNIALIVYAQHVVNNPNNLLPGAPQGFLAGLPIGITLGIISGFTILHLLTTFFTDVRALRLLLRYHDALEELRRSTEWQMAENGVGAEARS